MAHFRRHIPAVWLFVAAVLIVRALVPSGWMPMVEQGGVRIVLCTGQGPVMATLERDGRIRHDDGRQTEGTQDAGRDTCPFGTVAQPFHPPAAPTHAEPLPLVRPQAAPAPVTALIAARKALRPPARGPPAFA